MVFQVPDANMIQKRDASQEAVGRPGSQRHKNSAGAAVAAPGKDVQSLTSQVSELDKGLFGATEEAAEIAVPEDSARPATKSSRSDPWHVPLSQQRPSTSQKRSMHTVTLEAEMLDHILTLLLQSSRRLNDLEATNYYTHMIPTSSEMCMHIDQVYQGYLVTAQENKEHTMGPPAIHRGIALLRQVMKMEESLQKKDGLKVMWPVVKAALDELTQPEGELSDAQSIVGHCKISTMYERSNTRLTFTFPQIVECCGKTTTLGSVVSRLLRSMGYARKLGVAPPGFLDRKLSEALTALRDK